MISGPRRLKSSPAMRRPRPSPPAIPTPGSLRRRPVRPGLSSSISSGALSRSRRLHDTQADSAAFDIHQTQRKWCGRRRSRAFNAGTPARRRQTQTPARISRHLCPETPARWRSALPDSIVALIKVFKEIRVLSFPLAWNGLSMPPGDQWRAPGSHGVSASLAG